MIALVQTRLFFTVVFVLLGQASHAQNNRNAVASPSDRTVVPAAPLSAISVLNGNAIDALLNEDLIRSLRDPFQLPAILSSKKDMPKSDLEVFPLKDFKLNGVISGPKKTRAMVTSPGNKVFFVRMGDRMGVREGRVTQVSSDAIRVTEYYVDEHGKKLPDVYELKITGELNSLSKKDEE